MVRSRLSMADTAWLLFRFSLIPVWSSWMIPIGLQLTQWLCWSCSVMHMSGKWPRYGASRYLAPGNGWRLLHFAQREGSNRRHLSCRLGLIKRLGKELTNRYARYTYRYSHGVILLVSCWYDWSWAMGWPASQWGWLDTLSFLWQSSDWASMRDNAPLDAGQLFSSSCVFGAITRSTVKSFIERRQKYYADLWLRCSIV